MRLLFILSSILLSNAAFTQLKKTNTTQCLNVDTTYNHHSVFNYFTDNEIDSPLNFQCLSIYYPVDTSFFKKEFVFKHVVKASNDSLQFFGSYKVYFMNKPLFKFKLVQGKIEGVGYMYYPNSERVAVQGMFQKGELHGLISLQDYEGRVYQIMKFKKGKLRRLIYYRGDNRFMRLRKLKRKKLVNPFRIHEIIIM